MATLDDFREWFRVVGATDTIPPHPLVTVEEIETTPAILHCVQLASQLRQLIHTAHSLSTNSVEWARGQAVELPGLARMLAAKLAAILETAPHQEARTAVEIASDALMIRHAADMAVMFSRAPDTKAGARSRAGASEGGRARALPVELQSTILAALQVHAASRRLSMNSAFAAIGKKLNRSPSTVKKYAAAHGISWKRKT